MLESRKLLVLALVIVVSCGLFAGCTNNNSTPQNGEPNGSPSANEQLPNPTPDPETPDLSPIGVPVAPGGGSGTNWQDPADLSAWTESTTEKRFYKIVGQLPGAPGTVVKTTESNDFRFSIVVPIIPDALKNVVDDRGDHYYMIYMESKIDDRTGAILAFYEESSMFMVGGGEAPENCGITADCSIASSDGALFLRNEYVNFSTIFVNGDASVLYLERGDIVLDSYDLTSFRPNDEHISAVISAIAIQQ